MGRHTEDEPEVLQAEGQHPDDDPSVIVEPEDLELEEDDAEQYYENGDDLEEDQ